MTCKDCIHYDICTFHLTADEYKDCVHFKNKADVVEVVRCKDCTWYIGRRCGNPFGLKSDHIIPSEFCSNGERKE